MLLARKIAVITGCNKLIGKSNFLIPLINASIRVKSARYIDNTTIAHVVLSNNSDAPYTLKNQSIYDFYNSTNLVTLPAHGNTIVDVRTIDKKRKFELQFEVLSALIAPNSHPVISVDVRPIQ